MWTRRTLSLLGAAAPLAAQAAADRIDAFITERMRVRGIPGAAVAATIAGRRLKQKGYGKASLEFDIAADDATVFPMASASKIFAALTAGILSESGALDLDGSIRTYLPELPPAFADIRIRHLLSHTSGLGGFDDSPGFTAEKAARERNEAFVGDLKLDVFTDAELIAYAAATPAKEAPGAVWRYNQLPYFLFGQAVSRMSGVSYADTARRLVLGPLGMATAAYGDHRAIIPRRISTNYTRQYGPLQNFGLIYPPSFWPAAGLNASAADMARFFQVFEPGRLLRRETLQRLWTPTRLTSGRDVPYGMGFDLAGAGKAFSAGHEGGGCCYVRWWPARRLGVAILFNLSGSREDGVDERLGELLLKDA